MSGIDLIIFDCDGVLVDSEIIAARVEADLLTEAGYPISAEELAETYAGLTFDSVTGLVSSGLSSANLAGGLTGEFIVGTAQNGAGSIGDIYFSVVPEPTPWMLIAGLGLGVACRRRRRQD